MAACNSHNQELQRKVSQLEKCNMWDISIFPIFTLFPWSAGGVYNDISATRAAVNIWICRESLLIFSSLCAPQVTDGATAQTAGSGHEYL